jgi:hypothetical protein
VGKEVSYCQVCGDRLGVGEAAERQVYVHDGRRFCATCRPREATAKTTPAERRKSSTKLRSQAPSAPCGRESTRIRRRPFWPMGLVAASAVALAIGIAVAAGGGASEPRPAGPRATETATPDARPAPKPDPGSGVAELIARIREIRQSDLLFERRDEVRRLLAEAASKAGPRVEELDLLTADYDRLFEEAAARLADFTRSEAARMAAKQRYADAIERLDAFPAAFRASKAAGLLRLLREDYLHRKSDPGAVPASPPTAPRRII